MLLTINLPPGQYRNGTEYQAKDRWRDADLIRWHEGAMRPIGGWIDWGTGTITGVCRGAHTWIDNSDNPYLATGTATGLFVFTDNDTVGTLTPAGLTGGNVDASPVYFSASGFGTGNFGDDLFGYTPSGTSFSEATVWSLDNWGANLIACNAADGKIYEWTPPTAGALSAITNAPTSCSAILVTNERILMAFGAGGDPRKIQWSDQEDNTLWAAAATNQAGDFLLNTTGRIMQGVKARGQVLILTDRDAHTATYVGPNDIYSINLVGSSCGAVSRVGAVTVDEGTFWMGNNDFFLFNGEVNTVPCDVSDYVFGDINRNQLSKVWACANSRWSEIWWFYVSSGSTEIDRYVAYNYKESFWMTGDLARTAGVGRDVYPYPVWIDSSGDPYLHEFGTTHGSETPYAESGPIALGDGEQVLTAHHMYPDEQALGEATATFKTRFYPNDTETSHGPYTLATPTSIRFTGRQMRMRVTDNTSGDWRVGVQRIDVRERGKR